MKVEKEKLQKILEDKDSNTKATSNFAALRSGTSDSLILAINSTSGSSISDVNATVRGTNLTFSWTISGTGSLPNFLKETEKTSPLKLDPELLNQIMRDVDNRISERLEEQQKLNDNRFATIEENIRVLLQEQNKADQQFSDMSDPDLQWIAAHVDDLAQYEGKYVAISNGKILGIGSTSTEALKQAEENDPDCDPLIHLVSRRGLHL